MPLPEKTYLSLLVESGLMDAKAFAAASQQALSADEPLEAALVGTGAVSNEQLGKLVADAYGVPFVNLKRVAVDPAAVTAIPEVLMRKRSIIAYARDGATLKVAMTDPGDVELSGFVEKKTGATLEVGYTTPGLFEEAMTAYGANVVGKINAAVERLGARQAAGKAEEGGEEVLELADLIFQYGYANRASDIHIEPQEKGSVVRYRVDGLLQDVARFPKEVHALVVARVKILANLRTDEHQAAQDGKFRFRVNGEPLDLRVSVVPVVNGEKVVLRLLSDKGRAFTLETLGLRGEDLEKVRRAADRPYGMLLATGPTGSGKTTSMYAVLKILNKRDVNIQTIEDPVEYDLEGVNQIQVNARTGLTFAAGLRSIVRQDPDIIMVGEIRDEETASIAVNSAMTGHLVLSTLHTNDAATALPRLFDMGVEPFLVGSSVNVIIAQRLVRRICGSCITSVTTDLSAIEKSLPPELYKKYFGTKKTARTYKGKGCPTCGGSGYAGRLGVYEVMEVTDAIRELITARADAGVLKQKAVEEGMTTMFEDGIRKVVEGTTTFEEVLRVAAG